MMSVLTGGKSINSLIMQGPVPLSLFKRSVINLLIQDLLIMVTLMLFVWFLH